MQPFSGEKALRTIKKFWVRLSAVLALITALSVVIAPIPVSASEPSYTISIESTDDWSGNIGGGMDSSTVEGSGDQNYQVTGFPAVAVVQRTSNYEGCLKVTITNNGNGQSKSKETCADYGVVTLTGSM